MVCSGVAVASPTVTAPAPSTDAAANQTIATASSTSATTATAPAAADVAQTGPLSDVPEGHWAYDAVAQLVKDGLIKGYPDGTFKGRRPMTRYEAAVLAYRAVDQIEAQITAGKAVTQADIDAANKLLAAFGNELKAVEAHVDKLQKQADATSSLAAATAATVRRQQIHLSFWERAFNYDQSIQANNGPLPVRVSGYPSAGVVNPGAALPGYVGGPTGSSVVGPAAPGVPGSGVAGGLTWGNQEQVSVPQNSNTIGNQNHGLGMSYLSLQFGGNPDDHSQYLVKLTNTFRYASTSYLAATTPAYCVPAGAGATAVTGANCTGANAGPADSQGVVNSITRLQDLWYQYTSPGGIYAKVGKIQMDEGPKQTTGTAWSESDYLNGGRVGYRNATFNIQAGYGMVDAAATQQLLYAVPAESQVLFGEADLQLDKGHTDIGVTYTDYLGLHQSLWDPYAILCQGVSAPTPATPVSTTVTGTNGVATSVLSPGGNLGTSKIIPLRNGQVYTAGGCGAGYAPISFGANATGFAGPNAGLPVTGAYVTNGAGAAYPNLSTIGAFIVENIGRFRFQVEGTDRFGNDPFTGSRWTQPYSGYVQIDDGPFIPVPGVKGKTTIEFIGYAAGFNSLNSAMGYYAGPAYWSNFITDPSGYFYGQIGVKHYISDYASLGIFAMHLGLLPNTIIPAGGANCPGCAITGDSRNAIFGELFLGF
jgi:hypothetical protein